MNQSTNTAEASSGPTTRIRIYLRASNLPKSLIAQGYRQPDSLARVSVIAPIQDAAEVLTTDASGCASDGEDGELCRGRDSVVDETEVVYKSSNPRWTVSFSAHYEYGSQLLFFVEVFAIRGDGDATSAEKGASESIFKGSIGGMVGKREMKLLGSAVFDVQDLLGTKSHVKARRLRMGGVIYAHIEQQYDTKLPTSSINSTISSAIDFRSSRNHTEIKENSSLMLFLRLRGEALTHTHSIHSKLSPSTVSKPETYFEIARPSKLTNDWIVVYRSPPVKESTSPMWDEAVIPFDSLSESDTSTSRRDPDLTAYPVKIIVYKVKRKKCKSIGSFEATVQDLVNAFSAVANATNENVLQLVSITEDHPRTFQLRSSSETNSTCEITGSVSVVTARVGQDYNERSQRFLNDSYDDCSTITSMEDDSKPNESASAVNDQTISPLNVPHKFFDYVNSGLNIDFCVAIDFTSSNGDPRLPGTLHYSRNGMMNDYEEAIESIGNTIEKYSASKEFPVWGFGAKFDGEVRNIFQCGAQPTATSTEGVLKAYRTVFETGLIMSGPTVILSVLRAAALRARKFGVPSISNLKYCVLLILTDGIVTDLSQTQELVRSYRDLPLSVVVVGIGRADFTEMHKWNSYSDDVRGRFTFADYRQNQYDSMALSRKALQRVPIDVRDYFLGKGVFP